MAPYKQPPEGRHVPQKLMLGFFVVQKCFVGTRDNHGGRALAKAVAELWTVVV